MSVRDRLMKLSRERGEDFQLLLTLYSIERLLYRLGCSGHSQNFVLKGAMLFTLWTGRMHRPTRDLDLLGLGKPDRENLATVFRDLCGLPVDEDGLEFRADTIIVEPIREEQEYGGWRIRFQSKLAGARIDLQVDIGFGDAITPSAQEIQYPTLLNLPPPRLRSYPRETVIAEKLQAMVKLGMANTRLKDFYDLWIMAREFDFKGAVLRDAIVATFERRRTALPSDPPVALTDLFAQDKSHAKQWQAFLNRSGLTRKAVDLGQVIVLLNGFLVPTLTAACRGDRFSMVWHRGGPWRE